MSFAEYPNFDAIGLADLISRGEVSPRDVAGTAVEQIERHNPTLNAVVTKTYSFLSQVGVDPGRRRIGVVTGGIFGDDIDRACRVAVARRGSPP